MVRLFKIILAEVAIMEDIVLDMVEKGVRIRSLQRKINRRLLVNITEVA